jgi:hypothetical protein
MATHLFSWVLTKRNYIERKGKIWLQQQQQQLLVTAAAALQQVEKKRPKTNRSPCKTLLTNPGIVHEVPKRNQAAKMKGRRPT